MEEARVFHHETSEIEEILDSVDKKFDAFKNFDITFAPPVDHHFILHSRPLVQHFLYYSTKAVNEYVKLRSRIKQERELLEKNLPRSVFVRGYENRIDLMRVVIVGLPSCRYAYSLFIFDIHFPKDYPSKPPLIFQHHNCSLIDWNLDSKKIISKYRWDPETSNICRIIEFIQRHELRFSKIYDQEDEKDFILTHKTMLSILRSPPSGFEEFVKGYFRKYSHAISTNFKLKGNLSESQMNTDLFFEMIGAFEANGSYCKHLVYGVKRGISHESDDLSAILEKKVIKGEVKREPSMGVLFKRALSKTNNLITQWLQENDTNEYRR